MDTIIINKIGTFLIQLNLSVEKYFYQKKITQNLSGGYLVKSTLYASKQVLINSEDEILYIDDIVFKDNTILIQIPSNKLKDNTFYIGNVYLQNDKINFPIYKFQLKLDNYYIPPSLVYNKGIVLNEQTYLTLTSNMF